MLRHSILEPTCRRDDPVLDPVVDHPDADTELFGYLLRGQFLRILEWRRWNPISPTDPVNDLRGIWPALGGGVTVSMELSCNLVIRQALSQLADSFHDCIRVSHAIGHIKRQLQPGGLAAFAARSNFRGSIPSLHVPLSTLRRRPYERLRMTRGRCGSLHLQPMRLSLTSPCRFLPAHRIHLKAKDLTAAWWSLPRSRCCW
jgi:hypothetical protein